MMFRFQYPVGRQRHQGFTLVELLTVVGIIALLISILLPAINRARIQAKKTASQAAVKSMADGLEMFHNDFNRYPDSSRRPDPVIDWTIADPPIGGNGAFLSGAHWLLRALMGHDTQGVDVRALVLQNGANTQVQYDDLRNAERRGLYLETEKIARDTDGLFSQSGSPATGRPVLYDAFQYPIIYYRANAKAPTPFSPDVGGIYNLQDNMDITGNDQVSGARGWDFGGTSAAAGIPVHPMGQFGEDYDPANPQPTQIHTPPANIEGTTFVDTLHSHTSGEVGGVVKPVNADRFVIMTPGPDGLFGTQDDVKNP